MKEERTNRLLSSVLKLENCCGQNMDVSFNEEHGGWCVILLPCGCHLPGTRENTAVTLLAESFELLK